jgi:hypothetical protein
MWAELGDLRRMLKKRTDFYEEAAVWHVRLELVVLVMW